MIRRVADQLRHLTEDVLSRARQGARRQSSDGSRPSVPESVITSRALNLTLGAGLALVCLGLFYPGIMQGDSIWQWQQAIASNYSCWHPPLMAKLMSLTWWISGGPALFTLVQGLVFWLSCLAVFSILLEGRSRAWIVIFVLTSVPFWSYAATTMKDVWTAAGLNFTVVALVYAVRRRRVSGVVGAFALVGLMWAFRDNAATVLLAPLVVYFRWRRIWRRGWRSHAAVAVAAVVLVLGPKTLVEHSRNVYCGDRQTGMALISQYIGALKRLGASPSEEALLATETRRFEAVQGPGSMARALEAYRCFSPDPLMKYSIDASPMLSGLPIMARRAPLALLAHKACNFRYFLGLGETYWPVTWRGVMPNDMGAAFVASSRWPTGEAFYFERLLATIGTGPYRLASYLPVFLIALVLLLRKRADREAFVIVLLCAATYVLGFAISDGHPQFRYASPAIILGWLTALALASEAATRVGGRYVVSSSVIPREVSIGGNH